MSAPLQSNGTIDASAFPHIIDSILDNAPVPSLVAFRTASQAARCAADKRLFSHAVLQLGKTPFIQAPHGPRFLPPDVTGETHDDSDDWIGTGHPDWPSDVSDGDWFRDVDPDPPGLTVKRMLHALEHCNYSPLVAVRTLDIRASHLNRRVLRRLRPMFPALRMLRTHEFYTTDTMENYSVFSFPVYTQVIFTRPGRVQRGCEILIPAIPKGVKRCVVNVALNPADPTVWLSPDGYFFPSSLRQITVVFTPAPFVPLPTVLPDDPFSNQLYAFTLFAREMLQYIPRIKYTLVGALDLPPAWFGQTCPRSQLKDRILHTLVTDFAPDYDQHRNTAVDIPNHISFMTLEKYRATLDPMDVGLILYA